MLDLVIYYISGGKETRTYGIVVKTGQMVYECSMEGCNNSTENLTPDDIIVIQRHTQTVRAIEARTGTERSIHIPFSRGCS
jgi:translation initiation factor 2-alpha kinase 3